MLHGNIHAPRRQHLLEGGKAAVLVVDILLFPHGGGGEVGKQSLYAHVRQITDGSHRVCALLTDVKAQAVHAGVHLDVDVGGLALGLGLLGESQGLFVGIYAGADAVTDDLPHHIQRRIAKNQHLGLGSRQPGQPGLGIGGHRHPLYTGLAQNAGHLENAVAVGVSLDHRHRHDGASRVLLSQGLNSFYIVDDILQFNIDPRGSCTVHIVSPFSVAVMVSRSMTGIPS